MATDVDVSIRPRKEWALLYKQKQLARPDPCAMSSQAYDPP